ncbi:unnamed protein product [[Candida] boidinii]|nr:unnamed protein product [[Candida] boidinii]
MSSALSLDCLSLWHAVDYAAAVDNKGQRVGGRLAWASKVSTTAAHDIQPANHQDQVTDLTGPSQNEKRQKHRNKLIHPCTGAHLQNGDRGVIWSHDTTLSFRKCQTGLITDQQW